jgi:hypothetical protein
MVSRLLFELHVAGHLLSPTTGDSKHYREERHRASQELILRGILARPGTS